VHGLTSGPLERGGLPPDLPLGFELGFDRLPVRPGHWPASLPLGQQP